MLSFFLYFCVSLNFLVVSTVWILGNFMTQLLYIYLQQKVFTTSFSICLFSSTWISLQHKVPFTNFTFLHSHFFLIIISSYISKTSQQSKKVAQWLAQISESFKIKISPHWQMLRFDCTPNKFGPFGRCLPRLHWQILTDNCKNIDSWKQAGHNVVLIPASWPPGGFADVDLPWICNSM